MPSPASRQAPPPGQRSNAAAVNRSNYPFGAFPEVSEDAVDAESRTVITSIPGYLENASEKMPPAGQAQSQNAGIPEDPFGGENSSDWLSDAFDKIDGLG